MRFVRRVPRGFVLNTQSLNTADLEFDSMPQDVVIIKRDRGEGRQIATKKAWWWWYCSSTATTTRRNDRCEWEWEWGIITNVGLES